MKFKISLEGKTALVCGSSKGIGLASAKMLASIGANVILVSRNFEKLQSLIPELDTNQGQRHACKTADFSDPASVQTFITNLVKEVTIDIVINNTGGPPGGLISEAEEDAFVRAFTMHVLASQTIAKAVIPGMKKNKFGRIINIISTSVKQPLDGLGVSNTIRGAMGNWAKTMANELGGFGITVNNILPGATATERLDEIINNKATKANKPKQDVIEAMQSQIPMKRFAEPEEIAHAVAFLASPAASYINGINLPVDGGRTKSL